MALEERGQIGGKILVTFLIAVLASFMSFYLFMGELGGYQVFPVVSVLPLITTYIYSKNIAFSIGSTVVAVPISYVLYVNLYYLTGGY